MPTRTGQPETPSDETPHYHGHRARLRERFHAAGPDALSDYELLEMVLFAAQPRRDVKPLAKALLKTFGSFAEAVHAPETRLREIDGMGDASIHQLKLIAASAHVANGRRRRSDRPRDRIQQPSRENRNGTKGRQFCNPTPVLAARPRQCRRWFRARHRSSRPDKKDRGSLLGSILSKKRSWLRRHAQSRD
jgi:hypothetical protein